MSNEWVLDHNNSYAPLLRVQVTGFEWSAGIEEVRNHHFKHKRMTTAAVILRFSGCLSKA